MTIAAASYECIYLDVGINGSVNDGGVWNESEFPQVVENNQLSLPGGVQIIPFVFIGVDAFALKPCLMKPYPK